MYKSTYFPTVELTAPLRVGGSYVSVETEAHAALAAQLGDDDWTYAAISHNGTTEIVQIVDITPSGAIGIRRGIDGTERSLFPAGSLFSYAATVAGIIDQLSTPKLAIDTLGAVYWGGSKIGIPKTNIIGLGGMGKLNSSVLGCCPIDNAPEISLDLEPLRELSGREIRVTSDDEYRVWV